MQKYIGTMPFNAWHFGDYIRIPNTDTIANRDLLITDPQAGAFKFNIEIGWFEGYDGEVWRNIGVEYAVQFFDKPGDKYQLRFATMPFYDTTGMFIPIPLDQDRNVAFHLADGTVTFLEVR